MRMDSGDTRDADDVAFLERVARPLRTPEFLDDSFEERVMTSVRRDGPVIYPGDSSPSWWRSGRVIRLSPLTGLAIAAGLAGIVALSSLESGTNDIPEPAISFVRPARTAARTDTVHLVRFVFVDSGASSVEIVGDFNAWTKGVTKLEPSAAPGVWAASVALSPGRHEYAFIVNGTRWIADPLAPSTSDDFGTVTAVIHIGSPPQRAE